MAVQLCLGSTVSRSVAFYGVIDERIAAKLHTTCNERVPYAALYAAILIGRSYARVAHWKRTCARCLKIVARVLFAQTTCRIFWKRMRWSNVLNFSKLISSAMTKYISLHVSFFSFTYFIYKFIIIIFFRDRCIKWGSMGTIDEWIKIWINFDN